MLRNLFISALLSTSTALPAETIWHLEGKAEELGSHSDAAALVHLSSYTFHATISTARKYNITVNYQNTRDMMVFDSTNTIIYRRLNSPTGLKGTDITILKGPFPATSPEVSLPVDLQVAWMASYLNLAITRAFDTNALQAITHSQYLVMSFGQEVANQAIVRRIADPTALTYGVYLPGNTTKEGHRIFIDPPYKHGVMFQRLKYMNRNAKNHLYNDCEAASCTLYREPSNPEDVRDINRQLAHITRVEETSTIDLSFPRLAGLSRQVSVMDYALASGPGSKPISYHIERWSDLPAARRRAAARRDLVLRSSETAGHKRFLILLALTAVSSVLLILLLKRRQGAKPR